MKIAILDDDREQLVLLSTMLQEALSSHGISDGEIRCFSGSADFFTLWQPGSYDLILLDIYIDTSTGVDIARHIRRTDETVALVFCTSSNDFAVQSYEVNARYYLQKPVTEESLSAMLRRVGLDELETRRSIRLPDGYPLLLRSLIYTNYHNHCVTFFIQGAAPHAIYTTQAQVEQMLSEPCFYSANKGCIVNLHMVKKVTSDGFLMKDGTAVPISRRRYKEAKETFTRFHFQQLSQEVER